MCLSTCKDIAAIAFYLSSIAVSWSTFCLVRKRWEKDLWRDQYDRVSSILSVAIKRGHTPINQIKYCLDKYDAEIIWDALVLLFKEQHADTKAFERLNEIKEKFSEFADIPMPSPSP